jgi:hypothetical protein
MPSKIVEPDVVTVQMVLRNSVGEQTAFFGSAEVAPGGSFVIESDGKRLSGGFVNGTLLADFTDVKDNGVVLSGQVKATRR